MNKMINWGAKVSTFTAKVWRPQTEFFRFRYWKAEANHKKIFRFGYDDNHFYTGLLPRGNFGRVKSMKIYKPVNSWNQTRRTFGQNDYIDILGDERLHPIKIQENIPGWLKGFRGNELEMLRLRMKTFRSSLPHLKPLRWKKMQTRFEQCFYYYNYRKKVGLPKL